MNEICLSKIEKVMQINMLPKVFEKLYPTGSENSSATSRLPINTYATEDHKCDCCGSFNIAETFEGFVCKDCGVVLEVQKLEYYKPYNETELQHSVQLGTQIGTQSDRRKLANRTNLNKLNKIHSSKSSEEQMMVSAKIEISRIFTALGLPVSKKEEVFSCFRKMRASIKVGSKYRSPDRLVPLAIYFQFKLNGLSFDQYALLSASKISKKDFNYGLLSIGAFIPKFFERNRKKYISQKFMGLKEQFGLDMAFFYRCKKIMLKLWKLIGGAKDDVVVGVVSSIVLLCWYKGKIELSINSICDALGIRMSTIQSQVKKNVFERLRVGGFSSLVKSSTILKGIVKKLLRPPVPVAPSEPVIVSISDIQLPNSVHTANTVKEVEAEVGDLFTSIRSRETSEICTSKISSEVVNTSESLVNGCEMYLYGFQTSSGEPLYLSLTIPQKHRRISLFKRKFRKNSSGNVRFGLEVLKIYNASGPPS